MEQFIYKHSSSCRKGHASAYKHMSTYKDCLSFQTHATILALPVGGKGKMELAFAAILVLLGAAGFADANLNDDYPFSLTLNERPSYRLHWKLDLEREEITFAVNASASGWVGFGLSMRPQMIGSDVVLGWITDEGEPMLHVRIHTTVCNIAGSVLS